MKTTKAQAREVYDSFHGTLRCLNGGTRDENVRNAPRCRELLAADAERADQLAANPSKRLQEDTWLLTAIRELPARLAAFDRQYPTLAPVIQFHAA